MCAVAKDSLLSLVSHSDIIANHGPFCFQLSQFVKSPETEKSFSGCLGLEKGEKEGTEVAVVWKKTCQRYLGGRRCQCPDYGVDI